MVDCKDVERSVDLITHFIQEVESADEFSVKIN
jgi:hypothetical protein